MFERTDRPIYPGNLRLPTMVFLPWVDETLYVRRSWFDVGPCNYFEDVDEISGESEVLDEETRRVQNESCRRNSWRG